MSNYPKPISAYDPTLTYSIILEDDPFHSLEEVIEQLVKATKCSKAVANKIAMDAHTKGEVVCFSGNIKECMKIEKILYKIRLELRVEPANNSQVALENKKQEVL
jgi:ATP-dependent Clp protease adaptor protein ClpS